MVANVNWNRANEPPETSSAGQTSHVCFHVHMHLTMYSGMMNDKSGSWWPAMMLSVSVGRSVTPVRVMSGVPRPP
jgi:hypothetical protein